MLLISWWSAVDKEMKSVSSWSVALIWSTSSQQKAKKRKWSRQACDFIQRVHVWHRKRTTCYSGTCPISHSLPNWQNSKLSIWFSSAVKTFRSIDFHQNEDSKAQGLVQSEKIFQLEPSRSVTRLIAFKIFFIVNLATSILFISHWSPPVNFLLTLQLQRRSYLQRYIVTLCPI